MSIGANEPASKAQIEYIKKLVENIPGYTLAFEFSKLNKIRASKIIEALRNCSDDTLVNLKVLKPLSNTTTNELNTSLNKLPSDLNTIKNETYKYKYKLTGQLHLWGWVDFKEEINAVLIDYETVGNVVNWMIYGTYDKIEQSVLDKYNLQAEMINE